MSFALHAGANQIKLIERHLGTWENGGGKWVAKVAVLMTLTTWPTLCCHSIEFCVNFSRQIAHDLTEFCGLQFD